MQCPLCSFCAPRGEVHAHLVDAHPSAVEMFRISDSRRRYRITCPLCGAQHEARIKPRSRDQEFLDTFAREIRMVAFDMLLNHQEAEHS
jgi:hypothetical protein